jgi:predicted nucleotide-binding protein
MNPVEELSQITEAAAKLRARLRDRALQEPIGALRDVCRQIGRAWSGSNLGYHATVYFADLASKPPEAQFSSEWGLEGRWPVHQPHPGWRMMDREAVIDEIISRAGGADPRKLDIELAPIRHDFVNLKENAVSVLTAFLATMSDSFLQRKLQEIEQLEPRDPHTIAMGFLPKGQVMTRDTLALTQRLRVAPHQSVAALPLSAAELEAAIDQLMKATQLSAVHLARLDERQPHVNVKKDTIIFVGHGGSPLWRELKDFLVDRLHLAFDEFSNVPTAGVPTAERLAELLDDAAFAFLIMTAEDEQPDGKVRARENVVHEAGLFQGRLGFKKAIILLEDGCEEFSNIHGLGQIRFPKRNIAAVFEEIRRVLERERVIASGPPTDT